MSTHTDPMSYGKGLDGRWESGRCDAQNYDKLVLAIEGAFRCASEGYREEFKRSRPEEGDTGKAGLLHGWSDILAIG